MNGHGLVIRVEDRDASEQLRNDEVLAHRREGGRAVEEIGSEAAFVAGFQVVDLETVVRPVGDVELWRRSPCVDVDRLRRVEGARLAFLAIDRADEVAVARVSVDRTATGVSIAARTLPCRSVFSVRGGASMAARFSVFGSRLLLGRRTRVRPGRRCLRLRGFREVLDPLETKRASLVCLRDPDRALRPGHAAGTTPCGSSTNFLAAPRSKSSYAFGASSRLITVAFTASAIATLS